MPFISLLPYAASLDGINGVPSSLSSLSSSSSQFLPGSNFSSVRPADQPVLNDLRRKLEVLLYMQEAVANVSDLPRLLEIIVSVAYSIVDASKISVLILTDDKKHMTVFTSQDQMARNLMFPSSEGIAGYVATTGSKVNICDAQNDPRFNDSVDKATNYVTRSMLCIPIKAGGVIVGVIQALNKKGTAPEPLASSPSSPSWPCFGTEDEQGLESLALSAGSALRKSQLYAIAVRSSRKSQAILNVVRSRTSGCTIPHLIKVVTESTYHLLLAERVSVYLVDRVQNEIWVCVSKDKHISGLTLPIGKGIAGTVAKDGLTINVKDCYSDSRFDRSCDISTGFKTKSMLCMAVPGFDDESKPVAVIQAINKLGALGASGTSGSMHSVGVFDEEDEEALSAFCNEVKMAMRGNFLEAALMKLESDAGRSRRTSPQSPNGGSTGTSTEPGTSQLDSAAFLGALMGRDPLNSLKYDGGSPSALLKKGAAGRRSSISVEWAIDSSVSSPREYLSWGYDLFSKSEADLCNVVLCFFQDFGLVSHLRLDDKKLKSLIVAIHDTYSDVNPFHNFYHAFSTCHIAYLMMRSGGIASQMHSIDILATMIAALGHDADHPGFSNHFLVESNSSLSLLHSDDAVLERHHSHTTLSLLADPENDVLAALTGEERKQVRKMIIHAILGTDMTQHMNHVTRLHDRAESVLHTLALDEGKRDYDSGIHAVMPFSQEVFEDRLDLVKNTVHCADLSGQTLPKNVSEEFGRRVMKEFELQAIEEEKLGMQVTNFMVGLSDERKANELQLNFVDAIVLPLWRGMAKCFPALKERVERGEEVKSGLDAAIKKIRAQAQGGGEGKAERKE